MSLIQETISGLVNGVSQQPHTLRLKTQGQKQVNAIGTLVKGLYKRPPTNYVDTLSGTVGDSPFVHQIKRDTNEQYIIIFTDDFHNPIIVYDKINKVQKAVNYGHLDKDLNFTADAAVKAYIGYNSTDSKASERLRMSTVADYTVITNRFKKPAMTADKTAAQKNVAYVVVENWYDKEIEFDLNGFITIDDTVAIDNTLTDIAKTIESNLNNKDVDIIVQRSGEYLKVHYLDDREFDLSISGSEVYIYKGGITSYPDLFPAHIFPGDKVRILSDSYDENVHYYLESDGEKWNETLGFDILYKFDDTTLPHRLVRMSDGSFVLADIAWTDREVGDDKSSPILSFIDSTIQDVTFHKNRLVFVTSSSVVMSRPSFYFDFWPSTGLDVVDDDPIDVGTSAMAMREAMPFNKNLIIRGDSQQMILSYSGGLLSPKTVSIDTTTMFSTIANSLSTSVGSNFYFVCPNQKYITVREYFIQPDSLVDDAADVTKQVPNYIPTGDRVELMSVAEMDYLFAYSSTDPKMLYVYKYMWQGDEKPQSAWCQWEFEDRILGMCAFGSDMYILFDINGNTVITRVELNSEPEDNFTVDKQCLVSGSYDSVSDITTFIMPFPSLSEWVMVDTDTKLTINNISFNAPETITVGGDYSSKPYLFGERYTMLYEFSKWYVKGNDGSVQNGNLQVRTIVPLFEKTGYFSIHVTPQYRDSIVSEFSGFILGTSILDAGNLYTGSRRFSARGKTDELTIEIKNHTHLPCTIQGVTFEGFFTSRARII